MEQEYYQALLDKNVEYEGIFFVGVKTTGVFCSPTCRARKPKFKNCEFFTDATQALISGYRPCKICKPLSNPNQVSELVCKLVNLIEKYPEKRWRTSDFRNLNIDESTARRQFKKRFGMTFIQYARNRRMGIAMKQIREGEKVIETQLNAGYESASGFRDAFSKIMGAAPKNFKEQNIIETVARGNFFASVVGAPARKATVYKEVHEDLRTNATQKWSKKDLVKQSLILKSSWIDTPLGPMLAIGDEEKLYLLEFVERRGLEKEIERLRRKFKAAIIPGSTNSIDSIAKELDRYFLGELKEFKTPTYLMGSEFQKKAWQELVKIPYGETRSYLNQAEAIGNPKGFRAVANANGANQLAIIVPCHRIINSDGKLGGYGGGIPKKQWLIDHEKKYKNL